MPTSRRPYQNLKAEELCKEGERLLSLGDKPKLKDLLEELSYRTRSRKKLDPLAEKIELILGAEPSSRQLKSVVISKKTDKARRTTVNMQSKPKDKAQSTSTKQAQEGRIYDTEVSNEYLNRYPLPIKEVASVHQVRSCGSELTGVPDPFLKKLKESPVNELNSIELNSRPWAERFYHALSQWISDRKRNGSTLIPFQSGNKVHGLSSGDDSLTYVVCVAARADELFDGASVGLRFNNKKTDGRIVSITSGAISQVTLTVDDDLGEKLGPGQIFIDDTAMSIFLRDLLENECDLSPRKTPDKKKAVKKGLFFDFASRVLENNFSPVSSGINGSPGHTEDLNPAQTGFVKKALNHDISILWGPPGTGKTQTLTAVIKNLVDLGEKTLICSNTNMAVDQVFLKCCTDKASLFVQQHKLVRLGNISHQDLIRDFSSYVTIEGISEVLGKTYRDDLSRLLSSKDSLLRESQELLSKASVFEQIDRLESEIQRSKTEYEQAQSKAKSVREELETLVSSQNELKIKFQERSAGRGGLGGLFGRSPETLKSQIKELESSITRKDLELDSYRDKLTRIKSSAEDQSVQIQSLSADIRGINRSNITSQVNTIRHQVGEIDTQCKQIEESLQALKLTILGQAQVIGTTLAKTCMSLSDLGMFDNVIIDEASMASLPMVFIASSIAKKRVIISGDFSQLSPICPTNNLLLKNILGKSIFDVCGIEEAARTASLASNNLGFLDTQYRMNSQICDLISDYMYGGALKTGTARGSTSILHPTLDSIGELVLVDTSPLISFSSSTPSGSKINLLHSYIARKLLLEISDANSLTLGYCSPYAGQAQLFSSLLTEKDKEKITSVGTVHKFQGDERDLLVYDTVAAQSDSNFLGPFLNASSAQEEGAKNLNVAISRAKKALVVIADLKVLDRSLSKFSFLRDVLSRIQKQGRVIDAREIVSASEFGEFETELQIADISISKSALTEGMVDESSFFPLLYKSFEEARSTIVIFSGFFTPKRVAEVLSVLQKQISAGIKVKIIVPTNQTNGSFGQKDPDASASLVASIRSRGVLVEQRKSLHQKAVLIDEDLAWVGSLNPLSFAERTLESMLLVRQPGVALQLANSLSLPGSPKSSSIRDWIESAPPQCPKCGAPTVMAKSRYGVFYPCERTSCDGIAKKY